jgi:type 1 glutamine amidotransferase
MNFTFLTCRRTVCLILAMFSLFQPAWAADAPRPLRALLVIGGGWHDYEKQKDIIKPGLEARAHLQVDIAFTPAGPRATDVRMEAYAKPNWAAGYDVIIHDECSEAVRDSNYVNGILDVHKKIPAVNLHCTMHCYRWGNFRQPVKLGDDNARWYEMIGLQSTGHGPQLPIAIRFTDTEHPIAKGLNGWTTGNEELYNNIQIFDTAKVIARGKQTVTGRDGTARDTEAAVVWVNNYHGTRIFNTTLGHNNATFEDGRYLDLITRGLLWACDKLNDTYLKQPSGKN